MSDYRHFGVMLDCSRNKVMKISELKKFIDCLVKMGYNTLELYTEDTYEIKGEPYFGHFRGRYTAKEIKELDAYAISKGVELIPCIQTLAHLNQMVKWETYWDVVDCNNILLIGEEKTYELIEKMFQTIAENFTSRNVNIGMDEAHMVGLGKYLDRHGYRNRSELLLEHLNKVSEIAEKYGFTAHMWSDMFFRLINNGNYYGENLVISEEVKNLVPKNVELAYWDYYNTKEKNYDAMFTSHQGFEKNIWFAGGAWTWGGFAPDNGFTAKTMQPAMKSVRRFGIKDVIITMWGDNGGECSFYSVLPMLYAIRQYADGVYDLRTIKDGFKATFGYKYSHFMRLDFPNVISDESKGRGVRNRAKIFLYNDPFLGLADPYIEEVGYVPYGEYSETLFETAKKTGEYGYLFDLMGKLCRVLELKAELGIRTRKAYQEKDQKELKLLIKDYKQAIKRTKVFYEAFKSYWFKENKAFGWEVHDIRLAGLISRLETCRARLTDYVKGKISAIEELKAKAAPRGRTAWFYQDMVSASSL